MTLFSYKDTPKLEPATQNSHTCCVDRDHLVTVPPLSGKHSIRIRVCFYSFILQISGYPNVLVSLLTCPDRVINLAILVCFFPLLLSPLLLACCSTCNLCCKTLFLQASFLATLAISPFMHLIHFLSCY